MKDGREERGKNKWKGVAEDKGDERREGMGGSGVNEEDNVCYPTLRIGANTV